MGINFIAQYDLQRNKKISAMLPCAGGHGSIGRYLRHLMKSAREIPTVYFLCVHTRGAVPCEAGPADANLQIRARYLRYRWLSGVRLTCINRSKLITPTGRYATQANSLNHTCNTIRCFITLCFI